jgi:hypothetical protein
MHIRGQAALRAQRGGSRSAHESRTSSRRLRRSVALVMALPVMVAVGTAPAQAAPQAAFEIDGNTPVDTAGNLDWATTGTHVTDPTGNADTSTFTQGSKEFDHPSTWVQGVGLAPNQDDISDVYTFTRTEPDGVHAYFGFRRLTTTGVTNYDVEFNQALNSSDNPARPTRTVGDVMVRFEQDGNNAFILTEAYIWTLAANFSAGCIPVAGYTPAAGWCPVPFSATTFVGVTGEDGHFAEGTLNLTTLFGDVTGCREAFGTMNIRSFTGESTQSSLKDYVEPIPINVPPTCWKPIGITNAPRATYDVSYNWSVEKNVNTDRQIVAAGANATFTYRVLLTAGPEQRAGNELGGTVTLTNPNGSPMVATLAVTATSGTGCTFPGVPDVSTDAGLQVAVPAGSSGYLYTCTSASPPANGSSTATVSWSATDFPSGTEGSSYTASSTAAYTFALDQSTDEMTTVTDSFHGGAAQVLGTFTWAAVYNETDASTPPHTIVVATYTRTIVAGAAGTCASYVNTAKQTENDTGQATTSQETVTVCAAPAEVLPEQSFGKAIGSVSATCQGTVRARLNNRTGDSVTYRLRVGTTVHRIVVKSLTKKRFTTSGSARARVTLRLGGRTLDRVRIPARCVAPEVLPDTGLRGI